MLMYGRQRCCDTVVMYLVVMHTIIMDAVVMQLRHRNGRVQM